MILEKNVFLEVTKAIQDSHELNHRLSESLEDLVDGYPVITNTNVLEEALVGLVESLYGSDDYSYWLYELDFGKEWEDGAYTINGEGIDISTVEKLYDFLESRVGDK